MNTRSFTKPLIALAVIGIGAGALTLFLADTESTTSLSQDLSFPGVQPNLIAGRIQSKYHPLPWVGEKISGTSCPKALEAKAGATLTCTATAGGKQITIPVRVSAATSTSVTWSFER